MDRYVGHVGCSGRLVKFGTVREDKPRFNEVVDVAACPGCGGHHRFKPMWRPLRIEGEWEDVEAVL